MYGQQVNYGQAGVPSEAQLRARLAELQRNISNPNIPADVKQNLMIEREQILATLRNMMGAMNQQSPQTYGTPQPQYGMPQQQTYTAPQPQPMYGAPQPQYGIPQQQTYGGNRQGFNSQQPQQQFTPQYNAPQNVEGSRYARNVNTQPVQQPQPQVQEPIQQPVEQTRPQPQVTKTKGTKMKMNTADIKINKYDPSIQLTVINDNTDIITGMLSTGVITLTYIPKLLPSKVISTEDILKTINPKVNKSLDEKANAISTLLNNTNGNDSKVLIKWNDMLTKLVNDYFKYKKIPLEIDTFIEDIGELENGMDPMEIDDDLYSKIETGLSEIRAFLNSVYFKYEKKEYKNGGDNITALIEEYLNKGLIILPAIKLYAKVNAVLEDNTYIPKDDELYNTLYSIYDDANELYIIDNTHTIFILSLAPGRININKID